MVVGNRRVKGERKGERESAWGGEWEEREHLLISKCVYLENTFIVNSRKVGTAQLGQTLLLMTECHWAGIGQTQPSVVDASCTKYKQLHVNITIFWITLKICDSYFDHITLSWRLLTLLLGLLCHKGNPVTRATHPVMRVNNWLIQTSRKIHNHLNFGWIRLHPFTAAVYLDAGYSAWPGMGGGRIHA